MRRIPIRNFFSNQELFYLTHIHDYRARRYGAISAELLKNPELVLSAPHATRISRLDEVTAARKPVLRWKP